ncbi:MAG TPA: ATP-grasp domain-containing protein [Rhodanobacteraceae bacterium]|nr:ATP-grasp domain-containing protein [Rhodanobacteraceae bacterium]
MASSKVLILDGHSKAAAESVLSLPKACVLHVGAAEPDALVFASRRPARKLVQPVAVDAFREWVCALDANEHYDLILCCTEASLLALKSEALDSNLRAKMVLPSEAALDIALDKQRTADLAQSLGIKTPRGAVLARIEDAPELVTYPVVVKPLHSKMLVDGHVMAFTVRLCNTAQQRREAHAAMLPFTPVVEQEYFRGRGVGVELLFEHGQPRWCFAHERLHELPVTGGASSYRRAIEPPPELLKAATKLLAHLRWHGVAMVEFKIAANGDYRLLEINPRLWGSLPLPVAAGVNFPLGLLRLAREEPLGEQPHYRRGLCLRDLGADLHWFRQAWRERGDPLLVKPLQTGDFLGLLRPLLGRERWDLFRWREPQMWWHLVHAQRPRIRTFLQRRTVTRAAAANWRRMRGAWCERRLQRVLVLCYGNICRSPVVEALLKSATDDIEVISAGFHSQPQRASPSVWSAVVEHVAGVKLDSHRSRVVDAALIAWADLIIVMDSANWRTLERTHPVAISKAVLLGVAAHDSQHVEIADPYTLDETGMRPIAAMLRQCVDNLARQRSAIA